MDKETLSNYGWIVICVMVLAVMLAFASPFGNFVADAIKSTTQGLFDVNQGALDSAGIEIMQQEFDTMLNGETQNGCPIKYGEFYAIEVQQGVYIKYKFYGDGSCDMVVTYYGQIAQSESFTSGMFGYDGLNILALNTETGEMEFAGTLSADGQQIDLGDGMVLTLYTPPQIPVGGTYYTGISTTTTGDYTNATAVYTEGDAFPEAVSLGDVYVYGDYEYRYNQIYADDGWAEYPINSWCVRVINTAKTQYGSILDTVNGFSVSFMYGTFRDCSSLEIAPKIPASVTNMSGTFKNCTNLKTYVNSVSAEGDFSSYIIPTSVNQMSATFYGCKSLKIAPAIPSGVIGMSHTFQECSGLRTVPRIPSSVGDMQSAFHNCTSLTGTISVPCSLASKNYTYTDCPATITYYHVDGCDGSCGK